MIRKCSLAMFSTKISLAKGIRLKTGAAHPRQKFFGVISPPGVLGRIHMALRSYSVLDILLPSIIIIVQDYSQALNAYKCL